MKPTLRFTLLSFLMVLALTACGGQNANTTPTATITPVPTYSFSEPTATASANAAATVEATAEASSEATSEATAETTAVASSGSLDPQLVERGKGRYDTLECAACHGTSGEGTDKGSALTNYTKSETDFISFMRSGGSMGNDHQYSTNRLSESGGKNLYQFLLSLRTGS